MMLRSMSPDVIIVDEIGREEDADAILDASHAGVSVIATAHAKDLEDARGRPVLRRLLDEGAFQLCVELRRAQTGDCWVVYYLLQLLNGRQTAREPTSSKGGGAFG